MPAPTPETSHLSSEEKKSLTHGEFWIPEAEREVYREALETLNRAGVPCVVSGLYAINAYTGIYRETKDLDLLLEPGVVIEAAEVLKSAGFELKLEEAHWIAKALKGAQVDLIYGMANGIGFIDALWYQHSRPAILAGTQVRIAPPEELIWHRLYIGERHRFDMADVVHLILHRGQELDWDRLLKRVGDSWRLLASQVHFFDYVYPGHHDRIPDRVRRYLHDQAAAALEARPPEKVAGSAREAEPSAEAGAAAGEDVADRRPVCRGTMLSRFSFAIDVNEWGFQDERLQQVSALRATPIVEEICNAEVWDG